MEELILKQIEFKEKLVELLNTCGLPAFVLKPIIKDVYEQLNILEQQQYELAQKKLKGKEEEHDGQD